MQIITGDNVSKAVDYSFGDHRGLWDKSLVGAFAKEANATNREFLDKAKQFEGKVMTLYIDNIRLYNRYLVVDTDADKILVEELMRTNDLLKLCSLLPNNKFIIYTGQEDTPIDGYIKSKLNVLHIYAVNALYNEQNITPFPFGLQRQMNLQDKRLEIMYNNVLIDEKVSATKLLYINMGVGRNEERQPLLDFKDSEFITTRFDKESRYFSFERYQEFLDELRDHKFVVCPKGHGFDTHRIWETLYMRRVPVMLDHPYFKKLLEDFPVLYVNNWYEMTHALLEHNDFLYQQAQTMDLGRLDLENIMKNCSLKERP